MKYQGSKYLNRFVTGWQHLQDDPLQAAREGIEITKSLIDAALDLFNGIYLITPFLRYELTVELAHICQTACKSN